MRRLFLVLRSRGKSETAAVVESGPESEARAVSKARADRDRLGVYLR